jgi:hypothetical protein
MHCISDAHAESSKVHQMPSHSDREHSAHFSACMDFRGILRQEGLRLQVMFKMHVVHVNESAAFPQPISNQVQEHAKCISSFIESHYSPESVTCVNLEDVFGPGCTARVNQGKLQTLLASILDCTRKQDFLAILRLELLRLVAERLGCNKLLLGESASRLAANFIGAAAKVGRGSIRHHSAC